MSDVMLHGVLCMPPELWQDTEIDKQQRYSRYLAASRRIEDDEREIEKMRALLNAVWHCMNDDTPPDFPMREIEAYMAPNSVLDSRTRSGCCTNDKI